MEDCSLQHDWFPRPLPKNVKIGSDSWVYSSFAFLHFRSRLRHAVVIGNHTGVYNGTFVRPWPEGKRQDRRLLYDCGSHTIYK